MKANEICEICGKEIKKGESWESVIPALTGHNWLCKECVEKTTGTTITERYFFFIKPK